MSLQGRESSIFHSDIDDLQFPKPLVTLRPISGLSIKEKIHKNCKGGISTAELHLMESCVHQRQRSEVGIQEASSRMLVKSNTFKKIKGRTELENEVAELHHQLEKEVKLHSALEEALLHTPSTLLPDYASHDLPKDIQRLLTDIALVEDVILRLETEASSLQMELGRERTERERIEHVLDTPLDLSLRFRVKDSAPVSSPMSPRLTTVSSENKSRNSAKLPQKGRRFSSRATLKELLQKPMSGHELQKPVPGRELHSPSAPESPRRSLRDLWSALEGQPATSVHPDTESAFSMERNGLQSAVELTTYPSSAAIVPSSLHLSTAHSPNTVAERPRNVTPSISACLPDALPRKSSNPVKLLGSSKRLAFWNYFNSSDDTASLNNRSANPTPEVELHTEPLSHDCSSILDEDFSDHVKMPKLRRTRGLKKHDQSRMFSHDDAICSTRRASNFSESDFSLMSPRKSIKESPRPSTAVDEDGFFPELPSDANRLSEEMVRCMVDIYCHLAEPTGESDAFPECPLSPSSHTGRLSTSSSYSSNSDSSLPPEAQSPEMDPKRHGDVMGCESTPDPYKAMGKLPWANIGPYMEANEVPWLSVGKDQLEFVSHSLGRFRLLVERLAKINPSTMTHEQKLAFWINLYNALLMHAFLAYGIPRSDLKFFTLMQKAAYCVGGYWFNAAAIECNLLKAKIMLHRPQFALIMALHNKKLTDEQSHFGIQRAEPKVNFALSCGGHSSPMVRIYTPEHIHDELDCAFQDYLRATVGMTAKGRVLVPKLVYNYAREFVEDDRVLVWVCRFLPIAQVTVIQECIQLRHRRRLFNSATFSVAPYSFAFRYLFPKGISCAAYITDYSDFEPSVNRRFHFCT